MGAPYLSLPDPKNDAEGGIDPLGIAVIAEHMAEEMTPGLAARMARPRFMSLMALSSLVSQDLDLRAKDGTTPDVAFEWITVLALAQVDDEIRRVSGIAKARAVLREKIAMSARTYLKTPRVFGFHGIYKTLAMALGIVDDDLNLRLGGERLIAALETGADLPGLLSGGDGTPGGKLRRKLREQVVTALEEGQWMPEKRSIVFETLTTTLRPDKATKPECALFQELITDPAGGTRGEVFRLLSRDDVRARADSMAERPFLNSLWKDASPELGATLRAIEGFEALAKPLMDAFTWIRFLSTESPLGPVTGSSFAASAPDLVPAVRKAVDALPAAIAGYRRAAELDGLLVDFADVRSPEHLFSLVLSRHQEAQRRKPPNGKRPWLERTADGGAVVRPLYRVHEPPVDADVGVHFYRMASVLSFIGDLGSFE